MPKILHHHLLVEPVAQTNPDMLHHQPARHPQTVVFQSRGLPECRVLSWRASPQWTVVEWEEFIFCEAPILNKQKRKLVGGWATPLKNMVRQLG